MRYRRLRQGDGVRRRRCSALAIAVALAATLVPGGGAAADSVTPPGNYENMAMAPDCSSDASTPLQQWLALQPPDSTVDLGGACYQVDRGVRLHFPDGLTIENGTFQDLNHIAATGNGHGTPRGQPVFDVVGGSGVTFENLAFVGVDHSGYHAHLAFQAAIELEGTVGATLSGLSISHVFGDGINLEPLRGGSDHRSGHILHPTQNVTISGVTIRGAGRQGITLASVNGALISGVTMTGVAMDAFDFEADQADEGAKNVVIDGCSYSQLLNISMQGPQTGPITVENCTMPEADTGWAVNVKNTKGRADAGPIVFDNDIFNCGASVYVACFELSGATDIVIENSLATIGYPHDEIHENAYRAINNTGASFVNDTISGYGTLGPISANSSVHLGGGTWAPHHEGLTTTTLSQSTGTVVYGTENADTFTVAVTGGKGPAPTGTATVADTATESPLCMATLVPGPASVSWGTCTASPQAFDATTSFTDLTATYFGDGNYSDSLSTPPQSFTVAPAPTTTTLTEDTDTVAYGSESTATFSLAVSAPAGDPVPDGTVTVTDAATGTSLCSALLVSGAQEATAACRASDTELAPGTALTSVVASYPGDTDEAGSVSSPPLDLLVGPAATATTFNQSADIVDYGAESAATFSATVTAPPGVVPTGTVTVADADSGALVCVAVLVANPDGSATGVCAPTDEQFPPGTVFNALTASYAGDDGDLASVSSPGDSFSVTDPGQDAGVDRRRA